MAFLVTNYIRETLPAQSTPPGRCTAPRRRRTAAVCALASLCVLIAAGGPVGAQAYTEYQVKAAFLYKFAGFVEWPPAAFPAEDTPIRIGVLGVDPFGTVLDETVNGKKAQNRTIEVKRSSLVAELKDCHIIFVCASEKERLDVIFSDLRGDSILTVGDTEDFAKLGGIINLMPVKGRIGLEINVDAAKDAGIKISSQLLNLAKVIEGKDGGKS
jgi:hypothetical protein